MLFNKYIYYIFLNALFDFIFVDMYSFSVHRNYGDIVAFSEGGKGVVRSTGVASVVQSTGGPIFTQI